MVNGKWNHVTANGGVYYTPTLLLLTVHNVHLDFILLHSICCDITTFEIYQFWFTTYLWVHQYKWELLNIMIPNEIMLKKSFSYRDSYNTQWCWYLAVLGLNSVLVNFGTLCMFAASVIKCLVQEFSYLHGVKTATKQLSNMEWGCRTVFLFPGLPHYKLQPVQCNFGKLSDTRRLGSQCAQRTTLQA